MGNRESLRSILPEHTTTCVVCGLEGLWPGGGGTAIPSRWVCLSTVRQYATALVCRPCGEDAVFSWAALHGFRHTHDLSFHRS